MARQPKNTPINTDAPETPGLPAMVQDRQDMESMQAQYTQDRDLVNQLLGQAQAADAIKQISRTIGISKLAHVKETKLYRALRGSRTPHGAELLTGTWEEFCGLLGKSTDQVDRDIANLKAFGEEALESMSRMGIGYRDLREYRRLPEDERVALIEVAKSGDKDALVDLAEAFAVKHAKEKAELTQAIENSQADYAALDKVKKQTRDRLAKLERELARPVTDAWSAQILGVTDEISQIGTVGDEVLGKHAQFIHLCEALADDLDPDADDHATKIEQARVPIARLGEQLKRWGHALARMQFEFENRLSMHLDTTHVLDTAEE